MADYTVEVNGQVYANQKVACEALGVSASSVRIYCRRYSLTFEEAVNRLMAGSRHLSWTAEEDALLREHYDAYGTNVPGLEHRSAHAIKVRVQRLHLGKTKRPRVKVDVQWLQDNYSRCTRQEILDKFPGYTWAQIRGVIGTRGIVKNHATSLTVHNQHISMTSTLSNGWMLVVCATCSKAYILTVERARAFTHADCNRLMSVPEGWTIPWNIQNHLDCVGVKDSV